MTDALPPELASLRSRLDGLLWDYRAEAEHFSKDGAEGRSVVRGWGTRIRPQGSDAPPLSLWFDAFDNDLVLEVGDFGWFEWWDLSRSAWQEEVVQRQADPVSGAPYRTVPTVPIPGVTAGLNRPGIHGGSILCRKDGAHGQTEGVPG